MSTGETLVFLAVIGARFLVPLLIPRFPLPAIFACLVLDAVDQSIFQAFGYDPPGYQGYDKAMDVYYLAIAYLSTLRNWSSVAAYQVGRFLYFYRLVGVVAFELTQVRALLLIFPNTFEYFFMAYEAIRSRWRNTRWGLRWWIVVAALIWVFIKLPQEWWIHVAQLDVTDFLAENAWAGPTVIIALLLAGAAFWVWGRPRLLPPDHAMQVRRRPAPGGDGHQRRAVARVRRGRCRLVGRHAREGRPARAALGHLRPDAPGHRGDELPALRLGWRWWWWSMRRSPWPWRDARGAWRRSPWRSSRAPWPTSPWSRSRRGCSRAATVRSPWHPRCSS